MADDEGWTWWVGHDDERYTTQCDSRDEAVQIAQEEFEGAYIVEAKKPANIDLAQQFFVDRFLDEAEDRVYDDHADPYGGAVFNMTKDQRTDLSEKICAAISDWQSLHDLTFQGFKFSAQRNEEYIPPLDSDADREK